MPHARKTNSTGHIRWSHVAMLSVAGLFIAFSVYFPLTPDEASKLSYAKRINGGEPLEFNWPPLTFLLVYFNPFRDQGYVAARFFNLLLTLPIFFLMRPYLHRQRNWLLFLIIGPYLATVVSTATPQGIMVCILGVLLLKDELSLANKTLLMAAAFALNPALILILPAALAALVIWGQNQQRNIVAAMLGYLLLLPFVYFIYETSGHLAPALSTNGGMNLFYGNNPHALSHRGVGNLHEVINAYSLPTESGYVEAIYAFFQQDPTGFAMNFGKKLLLFFAPFDHLRSSLGQGFETVAFIYISAVQLLIYGLFAVSFRKSRTDKTTFALALMVAAWVTYSIFFVKIRFRVPFDFLLFLSILPQLGVDERSAPTSHELKSPDTESGIMPEPLH